MPNTLRDKHNTYTSQINIRMFGISDYSLK